MDKITVNLGVHSYPIIICHNQLSQLGSALREYCPGQKVLIVTNTTVEPLYGAVVRESLTQAGYDTYLFAIPDGEAYKTLETAAKVYDFAFDCGLDRKSIILALGGGVVGDLAGFVAATFMRGLYFVQVPTTLLAQVDSSVGGKVAVNHPKGKNIIGAFYQPKLVFADIATLNTLPDREIKTGLAEVIKYGVIWDETFFNFLQQSVEKVLALEPEALTAIVKTSCSIKAQVVESDEKELGVRAILNYGHTFGHAVEALTNYTKYRHGEAVAIGMVWAARLAATQGMLSDQECDRVLDLISSYGLPTHETGLGAQAIMEAMYHDKKAEAGRIKYILPTAIGKVKIVDHLTAEAVTNFLTEHIGG